MLFFGKLMAAQSQIYRLSFFFAVRIFFVLRGRAPEFFVSLVWSANQHSIQVSLAAAAATAPKKSTNKNQPKFKKENRISKKN